MINDACSYDSNVFWQKKRYIISLSYVEDFPIEVSIQEPKMGSCQYFTNNFEGNTYSAELLTITNYPNILNISL